MIVEDDFIVGIELENRLAQAGHEVVGIAVTAEEALEKATAAKPDLAIVDIRLASVRDGVDAAIDLLGINVPSIFSTAHGDAHTRKRAEQARPRGWLLKPYSTEALIATVNAAFQGKEK